LGIRELAGLEEAMTSDLEKEAREAAEAAFPPGPGRLGGKLYAGKPAKEGFRERSWFQKGFIAAAESREKEIASLRAKLEAVPVEEFYRASAMTNEDQAIIDRWLAGLAKCPSIG